MLFKVTKCKSRQCWITYNDLSPGFTMSGLEPVKTMKPDEMDKYVKSVWGISAENFAEYVLLRHYLGRDRLGLYAIPQCKVHQRRPRRIRFLMHAVDVAINLIDGNRSEWPDKPHRLYKCESCGREGAKSEWNWHFLPGMANSDYITHCPGCEAKGGDLFDAVNGEITLVIKQRLSHGARSWINQPTKEVQYHYGPIKGSES
jgi:hypothetical protein